LPTSVSDGDILVILPAPKSCRISAQLTEPAADPGPDDRHTLLDAFGALVC